MTYKRFIPVSAFLGLAMGSMGIAYPAERPLASAPVEPASIGASPHGDDHINGALLNGALLNSVLHRQMITVFALPEMQSELGLSSQQVTSMRGLKHNLLARSKDIAAATAGRRRELDALLSGDTSRTRAVKALFEKIADLRAQLQYAAFDTSNKMKALLNDAQRAKFNAMKPADVHQLMMSRTNMGEIQEMMQLLAAEEGMGMQGREMQKGMRMEGMAMQGVAGQGMTSGSHGEMTHDAPPADAAHDSHAGQHSH